MYERVKYMKAISKMLHDILTKSCNVVDDMFLLLGQLTLTLSYQKKKLQAKLLYNMRG